MTRPQSDPTSLQILNRSQPLRKLAARNVADPQEKMAVSFSDFFRFYAENPKSKILVLIGGGRLLPGYPKKLIPNSINPGIFPF